MWVCLQKNNGKRHNTLHLEVHNIPKHIVTKGQLEDEFGPDGYVKKIQFPGWTKEGQSPLYAYVHFHEKEDIRKAITIVNGTDSPFIQLGTIPKDVSEHDLRMWFQDCGEIENIRLTGDEMQEYFVTRKAIVIFPTDDDANRAVTHMCNVGFGNLPFTINGLVTQTEYQIPPNAVCTVAKLQQNLGLHGMNCKPSSGRFDEKKHPPALGTMPSKHATAPTLHTGQQHAGEIQKQAAPLQAGPNQQQQRQLQQQGNQQPLQPRSYQLPPPARSEPATAPPLHTEQQHAGTIEKQQAPLQAGPNQQQQRQMQRQANQHTLQPRSYQLPPPARSEPVTVPTLHTGQQQTPIAGAAEGASAQYPQQQRPPQLLQPQRMLVLPDRNVQAPLSTASTSAPAPTTTISTLTTMASKTIRTTITSTDVMASTTASSIVASPAVMTPTTASGTITSPAVMAPTTASGTITSPAVMAPTTPGRAVIQPALQTQRQGAALIQGPGPAPNMRPLTGILQLQPPPVNRGQYPLVIPKYSITQLYTAPIPQQQLAPRTRFTLLVRGLPYNFKDRDVWTIFQMNSYSGSLIETKVQPCTQTLTTPHATVTYGLRNDADQAIQNMHMKYLPKSLRDPRQIMFTVERYDY